MRKSTLGRSQIGMALGAVLLVSGPAQESSASSDDSRPGIEEIIVTATYRDTAMMDTPIAISSLTDEMIDVKGVVDIQTMYESIPSMSFKTSRSTFNKITIRGLGATGGASLVSVYVDEIPVTDKTEFAGDSQIAGVLYDLQRVEVLKGPQGTLYGEGSVGGLIRYITKDANPNEYDVTVGLNTDSVSESDDLGYRLNAAVNIPLIEDTLGLRIAGYYRDKPGILDIAAPRSENDVDDQQDIGFRAKLNWYPTEQLEVSFMGNYLESDFGGPTVGSFVYGNNEITGTGAPNAGTDEHTTANVTVRYDLDWAEFVSSTSYFQRDSSLKVAQSPLFLTLGFEPLVDTLRFLRPDLMLPAGIGLAGVASDDVFLRSSERYAQEFRLVSTSESDWSWTAGLYLSDSTGKKNRDGNQPFGGFLVVPNPGFEAVPQALVDLFGPNMQAVVEGSEQSIFGEVNYRFNEQWDLTLGGRLANLKTDLVSSGQSLKDTFFSPKIILSWRPYDGMLAYALASQGFRQGIFNTVLLDNINDLRALPMEVPGTDAWLAANGDAFVTDGDEVVTFEIGMKTEFLENRMSLAATIYYMDWKDIIMTQTTAPPHLGGAETLFQDNTGDAHSQGLEFEFTALLTDRLTLTVGGDYNDEANFDSVNRPDAHVYFTPIVNGQRLFDSPKYSWNTSLAYQMPLQNGWTIDARADWYRVTKDFNAPGYHKLNSRITLANADQSWRVALFGQNLKDEVIVYNDDGTNGVFFGQPRTIGLELRYDLGGS